MGRLSLLPNEPEGSAPRALVPSPRLRPLVQRVARHGERPVPHDLPHGRGPAGMSQVRLAAGGRIDRARPLRFIFDGRRYAGLAGDTLASALLANGVHLVGRSFKYHRPRGILTAGPEEPSAL